MSITTSVLFDRSKLDKSSDYEGHLMVSIEAKDPDFERKPVSIALCLDVSGSMAWSTQSGQSKIEALKETARKIVENLTSQDELAIIAYSESADLVYSLKKVESKEAAKAVIDNLTPLYSTNMSGGLLAAYDQLRSDTDKVQRVMLLTDGLPNVGVCGSKELVKLIKGTDSKATLSTFAFGTDADCELLAEMAQAGGGNHYFIKDGRDIRDVFARELGGIISCVAQNIEVVIEPNKDNTVLEVLNDYTVEDDAGKAVIKAEDVYVDETKHVLVKMKVGKPNGKPKSRAFSIGKVKVSYDDLKLGKKVTEDFNPKVTFVKAEDADKEPALAVAEQVAIVEAASKQEAAVKMANVGDFAGAQAQLDMGMGLLRSAGDRGSKRCQLIGASYKSDQGNFNQADYDMHWGAKIQTSAMGAKKMRGTASVGMAACYTSSAQDDMVKNFMPTEGEPEVTFDPNPTPNTAVPPVVIPAFTVIKDKEGETDSKSFAKRRSRNK